MFESLAVVMWPFEMAIKAAFGFPPTPLILAGLIGFIAWRSYRRASARLSLFEEALQRLSAALTRFKDRREFAQRVEEVNEELSEDPFVGDAWSSYSAELYIDESGGGLKSPLHPSDYFNERLYRRGKVNLRAFEATPNILVGLGLLATFLGLVAALLIARDGITADLNESKEALRNLLGASAAKFLTSVAALFCSIQFTRAMNKRMSLAEDMLEDINQFLERHVRFVSQERLTEEANHQLEQQTAQLERFNQDFAISVAEALDARIQKSFGNAMTPVQQAIEGMADRLGDINQGALEKMVDRFSSELSGAAQEHTTRLAEMLEVAANAIGEIPAKIEASGEQFVEQMGAGAAEVRNSFTAASENMDEVLQQSSDKVAASLKVVATEIEGTGAVVREQVVIGVTASTQALGEAADKVRETMTAGVSELSTAMLATVDNIDEAVSRAGEKLSNSLEGAAGRVEASAEALKTVSDRSEALAQQFELALASARELAGAISALTSQVATAGEAAESLGALAEQMTSVSEKLEVAASSVTEAAHQTSDMSGRTGEFLEGLGTRVENINRDLATLNNALAATMEKTFEGLGQFGERTTQFVKSVDKDLAEAVGRLSGAIQQLDEVLNELPRKGDFKSFNDSVIRLTATPIAAE
ncbi:MAG: anti-phage ZorAB system protein ZorA [Allosphingosinicella sp.]|uniref:anti-phage ZorAB system protein ZorA n=1 Tax=Allosphingosinicella sp. TaxID=2823234 RepID=UPI00394D35B3